MSIVLELTPAEEATLNREASAHHVDLITYIRGKVFAGARPNPDGNRDPNGQVYTIGGALAALDALEDPAYQVTEEQWQELTQGVEAA